MNPDAYTLAAQSEERHWWFSARRDILRSVLDRFCPRGIERRVLEVGCGNGGNLPLFAEYRSLYAVEIDNEARRRAGALPRWRKAGCRIKDIRDMERLNIAAEARPVP